jgi:CBS domain-containing protein
MQTESKTHAHSRLKSEVQRETFHHSLDQLYEKNVVCLNSKSTISEAARLMAENHIGDIVITDETDGAVIPVGIVTDRDLVINSIAKDLDPKIVRLSEVMTKRIVTASEDDDLSSLVKLMTDEGISRLPIVDTVGSLKGILSSKRLFQFFAESLCELSSISVQQQSREEQMH